jgi:TPR repeat protein
MSLTRFLLMCLLVLAGPAGAQDQAQTCRDAAGFNEQDSFVRPVTDAPKAIRLCQAALKALPDDSQIMAYLGRALYTANRNAEARQWIEKAAKHSQVGEALMGVTYEFGIGVPEDMGLAAEWYERGAIPTGELSTLRGNPSAQYNLGMIYLQGKADAAGEQYARFRKNPEQDAKWLIRSAEQGDELAQLKLGKIFLVGHGVRADRAAALENLKLSAAQGNADALKELGTLKGLGIPGAYANLAEIYLDPKRALHDPAKGRAILRQAVADLAVGKLIYLDQGDCQYQMGVIYRRLAQHEQAAEWFTKAAEQGNAAAQYALVEHYQAGRGDPARAAYWLEKTARQDHRPALLALLQLYRDTPAVRPPSAQVADLYAQAALQGDDAARYEYALLLRAGDGVAKNLPRAHELLGMSARQGHRPALDVLQGQARAGYPQAYALLSEIYGNHAFAQHNPAQAEHWLRQAVQRHKAGQLIVADAMDRRYLIGIYRQLGLPSPFQAINQAWQSGAFCECNAEDAFPGVSLGFTRAELAEIKEKFVSVDPRQKIDRTAPRFQPLNAIGQVILLDEIRDNGRTKTVAAGFGTGILLPGNLVLTNAHVGQDVGNIVQFKIGQTEPNNRNRWQDTIYGKVVTLGSRIGTIPEDWALIALDTSTTDWNSKYGYITPSMMTAEAFQRASENGQLMTAGYPGFKDPRYLWGQTQVQLLNETSEENGKKPEPSTLNAATSSGMSGGAILYEYEPGQFKLVGMVNGSNGKETNLISYEGFGYSPTFANFVNFKDPRFARNFGSDYKELTSKKR